MTYKLLIGAIPFLLAASSMAAADEVAVSSPNGAVRIAISSARGHLSYSVTFRKQPVMESSLLGIAIDGADLGRSAVPGRAERYRRDKSLFRFSSWRCLRTA